MSSRLQTCLSYLLHLLVWSDDTDLYNQLKLCKGWFTGGTLDTFGCGRQLHFCRDRKFSNFLHRKVCHCHCRMPKMQLVWIILKDGDRIVILISILIFAFPDFIVTEWIGKMGVKVWGDPNIWQMTFFTVQTKPFKLPPIKIDTGSLFRMNTFADCISCVMYDIGGFCIFTHDRDCINV